ncbi:IS200/IS605 family transposase [Streptococcus canis]|nr:IS200/IS605 family transposase [Streptococcus canis]GFG44686.1 IS200/IS605 family transposase [Streptococcus canis]
MDVLYHIVFTPKYRRKSIYYKIRQDLIEIFHHLCQYKGVEIIEGHLMSDHIDLLVLIPPKLAISDFMRYLKSKSALMVFDKHANLKYQYENRSFRQEDTTSVQSD